MEKPTVNQVTQLVPTRPDSEIAADLKQRILQAYEPLLKLFDEATEQGFMVNVGTGPNAFGKVTITNFILAKKY